VNEGFTLRGFVHRVIMGVMNRLHRNIPTTHADRTHSSDLLLLLLNC